MHALTLRERGEERRNVWLERGFKRIHTRPGALLSYWKRRVSADPDAANLAQSVWNEYASRRRDGAKGGNSSGPGSHLKRMLFRIGLRPAPGCRCAARAAEMDSRGPDWCEHNIGLIVGWLREEAARAKIPFMEIAARLLIRRAIRAARKSNVNR